MGTADADERSALAALYDAHAAWMYRHALMLLADHDAAEDAVHAVFVKLAAMGDGVESIQSPPAYLRRAIRGECLRMIKNRQRIDQTTGDRPLLEAAIESVSGTNEQDELERALRTLPIEQREVVHLKMWEHMTFEQIAEATGVSINTAASRYRYAIEKLRRQLSGAPVGGNHS